MLKIVNKYINTSIIISVIFILLGLVCIFKPDLSFDVLTAIIIAIFIINGILLIMFDYQNRFLLVSNFFYGILSVILGIVLLAHPDALKVAIPFIVGIWFMASGFLNLKISTLVREESTGYMILSVIMALVSIACGLILIIKPAETVDVLVITLGILFLIYAISNIIDMLIVKKYLKEIVKIYNKNIKIIDE